MNTSTKTTNFTDTQTSEIVALYSAASTDQARTKAVEDLAQRFSKSIFSIRGKLVSQGVYVAKATTKAQKGEVTTKASLVNAIGALVGTVAPLDSLSKASKKDLRILAEALIERSEDVNKANIG